jgi:hypothetical protein
MPCVDIKLSLPFLESNILKPTINLNMVLAPFYRLKMNVLGNIDLPFCHLRRLVFQNRQDAKHAVAYSL